MTRLVLVLGLALFLPSCAAVGVPWLGLLAALALALGLSACGADSTEDLAGADSGPVDAVADAGGFLVQCCDGARLSTCFCPGNVSCNYDLSACTGTPDLGVPDQGVRDTGDGRWEPCCRGGVIESCFCPANVACNYGWFTDCGGGTCVSPSEMCGG